MAKKKKKTNAAETTPKLFLDLIAPTAVRFNTDSYILGSTYRCAMAIRDYPSTTEDLALLRHLGEKSGVTLHIYIRVVTPTEERQILQNASNRNRLERSNASDYQQSVAAEANLQDVTALITTMHRNQEPLMHCAVFIELAAADSEGLRLLRDEVLAELTRTRMNTDSILLRQKEGFQAANPAGRNVFGTRFERVLPASSVANIFPINYSGKTDPKGVYIGKDKYGSSIIVDLDRRAEDKTNANVLILGNSGQGKSYLLKLLLCNILESGKGLVCLDPEHELEELCGNLDGCYTDIMTGQYHINPLEPKLWNMDDESDSDDEEDMYAPAAFRQHSRLNQHISFLKDFFRSYKDFSDRHIDVIELMLERLYERWGMKDRVDFSGMAPTDFPILSDLYAVMEDVYQHYDREKYPIYPKELLQEVLLGLHSMCVGAESKFFNGHTNITSSRFLVFGVKDLIQSGSTSVKNAMLFNILSYLSDKLLTEGNAFAAVDELYLFLTNPTAIEYIRNCMKRVRKRDSALLLASQNIEDFTQPGMAEMTRPLFAIPTHQFLFNAGSIDRRFYMENLQVEESEYDLIRQAVRGECLYKCGNERHLLEVKAPPHKARLFGEAGGR